MPLTAELLEHGAYYDGTLGGVPTVARWHATKRRFIFGEYALGQQRARSVMHISDGGLGERFAPLSRTPPTAATRVSDYAFETAG